MANDASGGDDRVGLRVAVPNTVEPAFRWVVWVGIGLTAALWSGCVTREPENTSPKPWGGPAAWETGGLPASLNEGH